jgi:hypothetical protein
MIGSRGKGVKVTDHRKIKSVKVTEDGIVFDSMLERYCYVKLKQSGLDFECQKEYTIIPKFKYFSESVRTMVWTPDFYIKSRHTILETKGFANESFPLRLKMFKWVMSLTGNPPKILMASNQKEIDGAIEWILKQKEV